MVKFVQKCNSANSLSPLQLGRGGQLEADLGWGGDVSGTGEGDGSKNYLNCIGNTMESP